MGFMATNHVPRVDKNVNNNNNNSTHTNNNITIIASRITYITPIVI